MNGNKTQHTTKKKSFLNSFKNNSLLRTLVFQLFIYIFCIFEYK